VSPEKNSLRVGAVNAFRKFNVYVSKQRWLKSIWPPSPFHRATGIMASNPACSAAIHHRYFRSAEALSREVSEACLLERAGARLIDMVVPSAEQAQTNIHICMARADMADIHRDEMELRPDAIGPEVLRRLRLGLDVSGCDYAAARRWLAQWRRDLREMFKEVDLLLTPTTRIVAPLRKASADMVETTQALARFYRQPSDAPGCRRLRCPAALARRVCRLERNWWLNGWMKRCSSARLQTLAARFRSFQ
jgi:hypothetical protein